MPVLQKPVYHPQPVPWDDVEPKSAPQSSNPNLPINETDDGLTNTEPKSDGENLQKAWKEGYEAGYREGLLAGQKEGYRQAIKAAEQNLKELQWQQHHHAQQLVNKIAGEIRNELVSFFNRAEEAVTELAIEIARKVVEVEVKTNPEIVKKAVHQALSELKSGNITVRLNPEDFSLLNFDLSLLNLEGISVRIVPDESVERGGVVAESEQGFVDLQPSTKLTLLQAEVL